MNTIDRPRPFQLPHDVPPLPAPSMVDYAPKTRRGSMTEAETARTLEQLGALIQHDPRMQIAAVGMSLSFRTMKRIATELIATSKKLNVDLSTPSGLADAVDEWAHSCHQEARDAGHTD